MSEHHLLVVDRGVRTFVRGRFATYASVKRSAAIGLAATLGLVGGCGGADDDAVEGVASEPTSVVTTLGDAEPAVTSPESTVAPPTTTTPTTTTPTTTTPTTTTPTTTSPTTTTVPVVELSTLTDPSNFRNIGYTAAPGRYVTDRLGVPTEVTLDEQLEYINFPGHLSFAPLTATPRNPIGVFIHHVAGLVPAGDMATPREDRSVPDLVDPVPESFADWFDAEPRVEVIDQGDSTIAGSPAPWWDFEVDARAGETFQCGFGRCVTFVVDPNIGATVLGDEWRYRMWHLTAFDDSTVIAFLEATPETWDDALAMTEGILDSLTVLSSDGNGDPDE